MVTCGRDLQGVVDGGEVFVLPAWLGQRIGHALSTLAKYATRDGARLPAELELARRALIRTGEEDGEPEVVLEITVVEAAAILGCSARNVTKAIAVGRLAARKAGRSWLVEHDSVVAYRDRFGTATSA